jgi:hypothetical protein
MSKMNGLRAMREARYERSLTQATLRGDAPAAPTAGPAAEPVEEPPAVQPSTMADHEPMCGHRAISGRTCTREQDHEAKSHRYS